MIRRGEESRLCTEICGSSGLWETSRLEWPVAKKLAAKVLKEEFSAGPSPLVQLRLDPRGSIKHCNQHKTCRFLPENIVKTVLKKHFLKHGMTLNYSHHFSILFFGSRIVVWQLFGVDKFRSKLFSGSCSGSHNHTAQKFNFLFKVLLTRAVTFHA